MGGMSITTNNSSFELTCVSISKNCNLQVEYQFRNTRSITIMTWIAGIAIIYIANLILPIFAFFVGIAVISGFILTLWLLILSGLYMIQAFWYLKFEIALWSILYFNFGGVVESVVIFAGKWLSKHYPLYQTFSNFFE